MRQSARILVSGSVQGVGFRYAVSAEANRLGVAGSVENLADGTVRIKCEGTTEVINELVNFIKDCKDPIRVNDIDVQYSEDAGKFKLFKVIHGSMKNELTEGLSTGAVYLARIDKKQDQMLDKQDQMLDKQDQMLDKQDQMLDKQDQMLDKQDQMLDKQDQTITEIHNLSSNMHDMLDSRFERIESDVSKIKSKLQI